MPELLVYMRLMMQLRGQSLHIDVLPYICKFLVQLMDMTQFRTESNLVNRGYEDTGSRFPPLTKESKEELKTLQADFATDVAGYLATQKCSALPSQQGIFKQVSEAPRESITPPLLPRRAKRNFELSKTKAFVFAIFSDLSSAQDFLNQHEKNIHAMWDHGLNQQLPRLDSERIADKVIVRIPIFIHLKPGSAPYTYEQFCQDENLQLPALDNIAEESSTWQKPTETCCIM